MSRRQVTRSKPRVVHVTTTDMSLDWLLAPQLQAFEAAGYEILDADPGLSGEVNPRLNGEDHPLPKAFRGRLRHDGKRWHARFGRGLGCPG